MPRDSDVAEPGSPRESRLMGGNGLIPLGLLLGTLALVAATALAVRAVPTGRPSLRDAPPAEAFSSPATR